MVVRLKITVEQEEYSGLLTLALSQVRNPESQLRYILRRELLRLGLLSEEHYQDKEVDSLQAKHLGGSDE